MLILRHEALLHELMAGFDANFNQTLEPLVKGKNNAEQLLSITYVDNSSKRFSFRFLTTFPAPKT
jgi:hypothetical protein